MEKQELSIPIQEIESQFETFISPEWNKLIMFSAPFGSGKTTFLREFFRNRESGYRMIRVSPIRYFTSGNSDIINLIKYDILWQIFNEADFDAEEFLNEDLESSSFGKRLLELARSNPALAAVALITIIGSLFKESAGAASVLPSVLTPFIDRPNSEKGTDDEMSQLKDFMQQIEKYSILHIGIADQIIMRWSESKSKSENVVKTVLVIDDLDRLYPAELFRILNILSAAIDADRNHGFIHEFDKVLLVCDNNNIRSIYTHQFGNDADYKGYIEKFISHEPFEFRNEEEVRFWLNKELKSVFGNRSMMVDFLEKVIHLFMTSGDLQLRSVLKIKNNEIRKVIDSIDWERIRSRNSFLSAYHILRLLFNDEQIMLKRMEMITQKQYGESQAHRITSLFQSQEYELFLLPMLERGWQNWNSSKAEEEKTYIHSIPNHPPSITMIAKYTMGYHGSSQVTSINKEDSNIMQHPILALNAAMKEAHRVLLAAR